jgi:hypothetical protein
MQMHGISTDQVEAEYAHDLLERCRERTVRKGHVEAYSPHRPRKTDLETAFLYPRPTAFRVVIPDRAENAPMYPFLLSRTRILKVHL